MKIIQKRFLAFLLLCIPIRILFVYIAKSVKKNKLPYLGYAALIPATGFAYIYMFNKRKTGFEAGGKIWWNQLRPLHSLLYFCFAYLAITKNENAYIPLLLDVVFGLFSFIAYHASVGSFKKLL